VESVSQARDRPQHKMLAEGQRGAEIIHRIPGDPMPAPTPTSSAHDHSRIRASDLPTARVSRRTCLRLLAPLATGQLQHSDDAQGRRSRHE